MLHCRLSFWMFYVSLKICDIRTSTELPVLGGDSDKDFPKTRNIGWMLLKGSLKAVKELSEGFKPLKATISAILVVMDDVDVRRNHYLYLFEIANLRIGCSRK